MRWSLDDRRPLWERFRATVSSSWRVRFLLPAGSAPEDARVVHGGVNGVELVEATVAQVPRLQLPPETLANRDLERPVEVHAERDGLRQRSAAGPTTHVG